ncbi:KOW domain-containing RNA-binding protein [Eubacteriales bacterium OttesenSCG-928-M02]|nr:KOW domain-containing RNA-binding protein [Eubacteriales bacterium OttesenSCG-928-M02]
MKKPLEPGRVVKSKQGRDKDRFFVIYSYDGGEYAYLVDGVLRKLDKPKKKKIKHLEVTGTKLDPLCTKLTEGTRIFDAEVRKALEEAGFVVRRGQQHPKEDELG